jgi:AcrR family transcriptional regulator
VTTEDVVAAATRLYLRGVLIDMSTLARDLGISRATLYRRVGNHEELLGRVLAEQTEKTWRRVSHPPDPPGVHAMTQVLLDFMRTVTESVPLRTLIEHDAPLFVRVVMGPGLVEQRAIELVTEGITTHLGDGLLLDADVLAQVLVRVCDSFMYVHLLQGGAPELDRATTVVRLLLNAACPAGTASGC